MDALGWVVRAGVAPTTPYAPALPYALPTVL
jgi:hypothetical protein